MADLFTYQLVTLILHSKMKPNDWKAGLKKIPWHGLFSAVGVASRFLPPPYNIAAFAAFAGWRIGEERRDVALQKDTSAKAVIDAISQIGSAAAGQFIHF